jgi:predicted ATP-dependent protease
MKDPRITMQLESVLEATKQNVVESDASARRYVMQKLFDKVNEHEVSESGQLRALELIGKAVGMFTDRVEQVTETIDANELKKELESHLHLLDNVKKKVSTIQ